jgi:hypothetical protein
MTLFKRFFQKPNDVANEPVVANRDVAQPLSAAHAAGHHEGQRYFHIFENTLQYLIDSGAHLDAGHPMQIETDEYLRFRDPLQSEAFLKSEGKPTLRLTKR